MKLYKGDKVMQMVDKDQVQDCLDAGWSRTEPVVEEVVEEKDDFDIDDSDESVSSVPKRKIKPLKKKK